MKSKILILSIFFVIIVFPVSAGYFYENGDVLGNKTESPSQNNKTNPGQEKKALIGEVEDKKGVKVTVNEKGKKTEAILDAQTKIVGQEKKIMNLNQLKIKDKIAIISTDSGQVASDGAKIRKILKVYVKEASVSSQSKRRAVSGVVTNVAGSIITLTHQIQRDRIYQIITTSATIINSKNGATTITVGMRVAAVGDLDPSGGILAKRIHVIPGNATGVFDKNPINSSSSTDLNVSPTPATSSSRFPETPITTLTPTLAISPYPEATPTTSVQD